MLTPASSPNVELSGPVKGPTHISQKFDLICLGSFIFHPLSLLLVLHGRTLFLFLGSSTAGFCQQTCLVCCEPRLVMTSCTSSCPWHSSFQRGSFAFHLASAVQVESIPPSLSLSPSISCQVAFGTCWPCATSGPVCFWLSMCWP